jgi:hypothetical protein
MQLWQSSYPVLGYPVLGYPVKVIRHPKCIKVTAAEMTAFVIERDPFHGEWNYTISPNQHPP